MVMPPTPQGVVMSSSPEIISSTMTDEDRLVKMFMGNGKTMPTMLPCASDEEYVMIQFGLRRREASYGGRRGILCKGLRAQASIGWNDDFLFVRRSSLGQPLIPLQGTRPRSSASQCVIEHVGPFGGMGGTGRGTEEDDFFSNYQDVA
eukprot:scaffold70797_cov68-Attheya_sp.AAC.2